MSHYNYEALQWKCDCGNIKRFNLRRCDACERSSGHEQAQSRVEDDKGNAASEQQVKKDDDDADSESPGQRHSAEAAGSTCSSPAAAEEGPISEHAAQAIVHGSVDGEGPGPMDGGGEATTASQQLPLACL